MKPYSVSWLVGLVAIVGIVATSRTSSAATLSIVPAWDGVPCDTVLNGHHARVYVAIDGMDREVGGLDLLIGYDTSGLTLLNATPAGNVVDWEYFTYRSLDCDPSGCPGKVRLVGIVDLNNGDQHPPESAYHLDGRIAELEFFVSQDRSLIGQCLGVGWLFFECRDNTFSNRTGDTLYVPLNIADTCFADPRHNLNPLLEFEDGCICVKPPPPRPPPVCDREMGDVVPTAHDPDDPAVDILDILTVISRMMGGSYSSDCYWVCGDINCDRRNNLVDVVHMVNFVFRNGPPLDSFCGP